ncbi:hypothetical protein WOC76_20495 [Methylocystis sp. IM3]|jgi:hypothetical protein|uniref:hypothetical protein n=1 Tax=unclassified Methylocystis TaxID=2625913 RepID=UPI0030F69B59
MGMGERTFEKDMRIIVLRIAAESPNGEVTTTEAKERAQKYFSPTAGDLEPNPLRGGEPMYYQIIGNVIASHEASSTNIYHNGYAERITDGVRITQQGRQYIAKIND